MGRGGFGGAGRLTAGNGAGEGEEEEEESRIIKLKRYGFVVQFCWKETPRSARQQIAKLRKEQEAAQAENADQEEIDE